ncbi:MAG: MarR family transcriptional regulator [Candidatus Neomarinimicrobiota bacterium]
MNDVCTQIFLRDVCPSSISKTQLHILKTLFVSGQKSASDLSEIMHISRPAITQQVDKLTKLSLIARQIDPSDRRSIKISLTNNGQELIVSYEEYVLARHANILNYFTYEERTVFNQCLEKFIDLCLDCVDNLDILCLNCEGRYMEFCKINAHKYYCHLDYKQQQKKQSVSNATKDD